MGQVISDGRVLQDPQAQALIAAAVVSEGLHSVLQTFLAGASFVFDDSNAALQQAIFGRNLRTGQVQGNTHGVLHVSAGYSSGTDSGGNPIATNDVLHDYSVGALIENYSANGAGLVVNNLAMGDGLYLQTSFSCRLTVAANPGDTTITVNATDAVVVGATYSFDWLGTPELITVTATTGTTITFYVGTPGTGLAAAHIVGSPVGSAWGLNIDAKGNGSGIHIFREDVGHGIFIVTKNNAGVNPDIHIQHGAGDMPSFEVIDTASTTAQSLVLSSNSKTSGGFINVFHSTSAMSGYAISMNLGAGGGSCTGGFIRCQINGSTGFFVNSNAIPNATQYISYGTAVNAPQFNITAKMSGAFTGGATPGLLRDTNEVLGLNAVTGGSVATFINGTKGVVLDDGTSRLMNVKHQWRKTTVTATPSASANTYGTAQTISPATGYYGFSLLQALILQIGGTFGSETFTVRITANYSDGTTGNITKTYTSLPGTNLYLGQQGGGGSGGGAANGADLYNLVKDGVAIRSLALDCQSTIVSSAVTCSLLTALMQT